MIYHNKARLLLAGAAFCVLSGQAYALDGNDLLAKINKALAMQSGGGIVANKVDVSGADVTLTDARFSPAAGEQGIPLGTIRFEGVEEDNGGYTVETVSFDDVNMTEGTTNYTATDISLSDLVVPADPDADSIDAILLYREAHVGSSVISIDGKPIFSVGDTRLTTDIADDSSSIGFGLHADAIKGDLSFVEDAKTKDALQQLGITSLNGTMSMEGSWALEDGTLSLDEYAFDFNDIGRLNIAFSISGYTLDFIKSANETAEAMQANPNKEEAQQAASLAMLGLMQRLTFNSAQVDFADAGITNRALDYAGKQQGTTGEQMAQMLKGMAPLLLAQYNMPELQKMVTAALNTYLDNPGNFIISAEPENPVPFPMIMGAAMGAPNTLPDVLGVTVEANRRR